MGKRRARKALLRFSMTPVPESVGASKKRAQALMTSREGSGADKLRPGAKVPSRVLSIEPARSRWHADELAAEEPLEIRLTGDGWSRTLSLTMRTPGNDFELVAGFLYAEGVVKTRQQLAALRYCVGKETSQQYNVVSARLSPGVAPDFAVLQRNFYVTSACGVCGKAGLDALRLRGLRPPGAGPRVSAQTLFAAPQRLRAAQALFRSTGGLHAAALADTQGRIIALREDVGRHNALDKLIGWALLNDNLPLADRIVLVSGRSSFDIMQKSLAAGAAIVCAVSAPSSLAVSLAQEFGMTLVGFLRDSRFNVYAGAERIVWNRGEAAAAAPHAAAGAASS
jgi:FdhD protein